MQGTRPLMTSRTGNFLPARPSTQWGRTRITGLGDVNYSGPSRSECGSLTLRDFGGRRRTGSGAVFPPLTINFAGFRLRKSNGEAARCERNLDVTSGVGSGTVH